jgi:succinyl-diaminopimelate desuccinylase
VLQQYRAICDQLLHETLLTPEQQAQVTIAIQPKARTNPYMESYVTSPDDPFVQLAQQIMQEQFGGAVVAYGRSVADENIMANTLGLLAIVIGPRGGNEHSPNEWASAPVLKQYTQLYRSLLSRWARK